MGDRVDVLVIAALPEEFEAAKSVGLAGVRRWEVRDLDGIAPFWWGEYQAGGARFTVALARPTRMGGRTSGPFAASLADRLRPSSLVMCGVCAGNPEGTALGDIVVGEPVYEWDEGKHSESGFEGDHRQFPLDPRWLRAAQDLDPRRLDTYGEAGEDEALLWFLEQLHLGRQPRLHPARDAYFPSGTWAPRLAVLEECGLIERLSTGEAVLTADGSDCVRRRLYDDVDGPRRLPFRVLAAPMASGSAVVADPAIWGRLKAMGMRKVAAVEMEGATIATIAHDRKLPWLVVKGVMDHADVRKDDRYKKFAARASAEVMFALLEGLFATTRRIPSPDAARAPESTAQVEVAVVSVSGATPSEAVVRMIKAAAIYGDRISIHDPGIKLGMASSNFADAGSFLATAIKQVGEEAELRTPKDYLPLVDRTFLNEAARLGLIEMNDLVDAEGQRQRFPAIQDYWLLLTKVLTNPNVYALFDESVSRVLADMIDRGIFAMGAPARKRARQPTATAGLLDRLPNFAPAGIEDVLAIRSELRESVVRFRGAMASLTDEFDHDPTEAEFFDEVESAWRAKVAPAVRDIHDEVKASKILRKLTVEAVSPSAPLVSAGIGVATTLTMHTSELISSVAGLSAGAVTAMMKALEQHRAEREHIRKREFYLLYQVDRLLGTRH